MSFTPRMRCRHDPARGARIPIILRTIRACAGAKLTVNFSLTPFEFPDKFSDFFLDRDVATDVVASSSNPDSILEDPAQLKRYAAWILPNTEYLSAKALSSLRAYVEAGGSLYLCCNVGRVDENRRPRENALADHFDIRRWTPSREELSRRRRFEGEGRDVQHSYEIYMKIAPSVQADFPFVAVGANSRGEDISPSER